MENEKYIKVDDKIRIEYQKRIWTGQRNYSYFNMKSYEHHYRVQERFRKILLILKKNNINKLNYVKILDVGCGDGNLLRQFVEWGANPKNIVGIELRGEDIDRARTKNDSIKYYEKSVIKIEKEKERYDIICLQTVLSSICDEKYRKKIGSIVINKLNDNGFVLWYDMCINNPWNSNINGISRKELKTIFKNCVVDCKKTTIAAPIAKLIPARVFDIIYPILSSIKIVDSHLIGTIKPM